MKIVFIGMSGSGKSTFVYGYNTSLTCTKASQSLSYGVYNNVATSLGNRVVQSARMHPHQ